MDERLPFLLALIGGIFATLATLGFAAMALFMGTMMVSFGADVAFPAAFLGLIFGWFLLTGVAGAIATFVAAAKLHREPRSRSGAVWAFVGGGISAVGGNMIAAGLAIGAGIVALSDGV